VNHGFERQGVCGKPEGGSFCVDSRENPKIFFINELCALLSTSSPEDSNRLILNSVNDVTRWRCQLHDSALEIPF
jgi:hypothetical protein